MPQVPRTNPWVYPRTQFWRTGAVSGRAVSRTEVRKVVFAMVARADPRSVRALAACRTREFKNPTEQDLIAWCRDNMAVYKVPRTVQFVDALPKSGAGKVMWRLLQEAEKKA